MMTPQERQIVDLTQKLLASIAAADWKAYAELCDESLTCFEPEGKGHLIEGLAFHKYYFDLGAAKSPPQNTIGSPHVRFLGENSAIISYTRLTQKLNAEGAPITALAEETRVWEKKGAAWKHVHFHRSFPS